jgi:EpsI family protein
LRNLSSAERFATTFLLLSIAIFLIHGVRRAERIPLRHPLNEFPLQLSPWEGRDEPLEGRIIKAAGVDDYVNRVYKDPSGHSLQLYIGYYRSQKAGDTIHSPRNCLPGGGWVPVSTGVLNFSPRPGEQLVANEYVIEKGRDSDLVVYWYQLGGQVVASEYWAKVWMVVDAIKRNRTDGALVRIWVPMAGGEKTARDQALAFARLIYPRLSEFVPN